MLIESVRNPGFLALTKIGQVTLLGSFRRADKVLLFNPFRIQFPGTCQGLSNQTLGFRRFSFEPSQLRFGFDQFGVDPRIGWILISGNVIQRSFTVDGGTGLSDLPVQSGWNLEAMSLRFSCKPRSVAFICCNTGASSCSRI